MNPRIKFTLPLMIFAIILFFFWQGIHKDPNLLPSTLVDKPAPSFKAPSLENSMISTAEFKGKVTLLNVWSSHCSLCKLEHPFLMELAKKPELQVIGLNYKDQQEEAKRYLQKLGNPFQRLICDESGKYAMQFGVYGTPETFLIDKNGIVRYRYVGAITLNVLENDLLPRIIKMQEMK